MIIPAAGRGTRLQYDGPKLLFPIKGKPLIEYLLRRYQPYVDRFFIVINPLDEDQVRTAIKSLDYPVELGFQPEPTGMLDAIMAPFDMLCSQPVEQVWITWCDQIGITDKTAKAMSDYLIVTETPCLVFPTYHKPEPYIHLKRDECGTIVEVLHLREGDAMPEIGENDCGLFAMDGKTYVEDLKAFSDHGLEAMERQHGSAIGQQTKERNFLPFIQWMGDRGNVVTYTAQGPFETVGINTLEDAEVLAQSL